MWWRRWVSPLVGSTAIGGALSLSCERRMLRRDGDFLFWWTAMFELSLVSVSLSMPVANQPAQRGERRIALDAVPRARGPAVLVPRRERQRQQQLVLDQLAERHFLAGDDTVGCMRIRRFGMDF